MVTDSSKVAKGAEDSASPIPLEPPLSFSNRYPLSVSWQNQAYSDNPHTLQQEVERYQALFPPREQSPPLFSLPLAAALLLLLLSVWQMARKKAAASTARKKISAQKKAHSALEHLYINSLKNPEAYPAYHAQVSIIIRTLLEEMGRVPASKMTTQELAASQKKSVVDFLTKTDAINFAQPKISEADLHRTHREAGKIVRELG